MKITSTCYFSLLKLSYYFTCKNIFFIYFGYTLISPLAIKYNFSLSDPQTMFINDKHDVFISNHIYELENQGPSPLPKAAVQFFVPQVETTNSALPSLYLNVSTVSCVFYISHTDVRQTQTLSIQSEFKHISQLAHDVDITSPQRRCNVTTLHQRWGDVV